MEQNPREDLIFKIKRVHDLLRKNANNRLQELDMTFMQHKVLVYLMTKCKGYSCSLKDLEHRFDVAQATMAGICKRLEAKGFVEMAKNPEDMRRKDVTLTKKGEELCMESWQNMRETERYLNSRISEEEQKQLSYLLDKVYATLQEQIPEGLEKKEVM